MSDSRTPPPPGGFGASAPPPPPTPPPYSYPPPMFPPMPPRPQVVHITAKPGGFSRAVGFIVALLLFGVVFMIGIAMGISVMLATSELDRMIIPSTYRDAGRRTIAVLPVYGAITPGQSDFVRAAVDEVLDGGYDYEAVVLRVDSPGGGVTASDQIWYEVERLRSANIPVIASYGSVAASGGYYVSCASDHILAEPTTITGSIGVIAQIFTMQNLADKVGIQPVTLVATGSPNKSVANDIFREWNESDRQTVMTMLDSAYDTFRDRVKDGRSSAITDPARLDEIADGSIYTAQEALELGLIDGIGYLDDAIAEAEKAARIPSGTATVLMLSEPPSLFGSSGLLQARGTAAEALTTLNADALREFINDLSAPRVLYRMR